MTLGYLSQPKAAGMRPAGDLQTCRASTTHRGMARQPGPGGAYAVVARRPAVAAGRHAASARDAAVQKGRHGDHGGCRRQQATSALGYVKTHRGAAGAVGLVRLRLGGARQAPSLRAGRTDIAPGRVLSERKLVLPVLPKISVPVLMSSLARPGPRTPGRLDRRRAHKRPHHRHLIPAWDAGFHDPFAGAAYKADRPAGMGAAVQHLDEHTKDAKAKPRASGA